MSQLWRRLARRIRFHPRLWWNGLFSYSRFIGHIWPRLIEVDAPEFSFRRKMFTSVWTPRRLSVPVGRRILALSPHADDESIGAGGLLCAHRGIAELHVVVLTDGAQGGRREDGTTVNAEPESLADVRRREMAQAARMLGAHEVEHLDFPDGNVPVDPAACQRLRAVVTRIRPDVILLPWILDGHPDHRRTNRLFARACGDLDGMVLAYEVWSLLEPNAIFDFSAHLEAKLTLVGLFESQLRTVDYRSYVRHLAQVRSFAAGTDRTADGAAEAYLALPVAEYCALVTRLLEAPDAGDTALATDPESKSLRP